jgi:hypothetical protein
VALNEVRSPTSASSADLLGAAASSKCAGARVPRALTVLLGVPDSLTAVPAALSHGASRLFCISHRLLLQC